MDILPQLLVNALIAGSIYALASVGLSLVYGLLKILNFAQGQLMMAGAYAFYFARIEHGMGLASSSLFAVICTLMISLLSLKIFIIPFSRYSFFLPFITTLSLGTLIESAVAIIFGVNVKSLSMGYEVSSIEFHGIYITEIQILII